MWRSERFRRFYSEHFLVYIPGGLYSRKEHTGPAANYLTSAELNEDDRNTVEQVK